MAPTPPSTPSFDAIITAGRQKKKNETLAQEIFRKGRRSSTPSGNRVNNKASGSLASRISKPSQPYRSNSSSTLSRSFQNAQTGKAASKPDLFANAGQANRQSRLQDIGSGFSIRGLAGPVCVVGRNFAPGTTAADIHSAMESVGGEMESCTIVSALPTVTAEMVFSDKANADAVISTFDNQKADGRVLRLFLKKGPPTTTPALPPAQPRANPPEYSEASYGRANDFSAEDKSSRRAEPEVQDGSYGFGQQEDAMAMDEDIKPKVDESQEEYQEPRREDRGDDRRDTRRDNRGPGRDNGYNGYDRRDSGHYGGYDRNGSRDFPRGPRNDYRGYGGRGNGGGRGGLYSDGYRPRGRGGFR